jgi:transglutaminase-like putative cysteine protease
MSTASQIPRSSIVWLLVAQFVAIAPHVERMSAWMIAIWLLCAVWRIAMHRGTAKYPGVVLRTILVLMGFVGILVSFGNGDSLDLAVALLILAFSMKLVEVRQRRDLYLVFYLAYFIVAASFLYSQSLLLTLYQIVSVMLVTAAMVATQRSLTGGSARHAIKKSLILFAQAVPVMLVFFLVFPRIEPLWAVAKRGGSATTGMSDTMSPGDFTRLVESDEKVFTVRFQGEVPNRDQLYWRGMTLSHFDGRAWSAGAAKYFYSLYQGFDDGSISQLYGESVRYQVNMLPSKQHWLFLLLIASQPIDAGDSPLAIQPAPDFSYRSLQPINTPRQISVQSFLNYRAEPQLSAQRVKIETQIPSGFNPQAQQMAQRLRAKHSDNRAFVSALLDEFKAEHFVYSLEPPALGKHSVDEFVFSTRNGFCEHYSNAMVFILRAAGIPARVVIGYQGGEQADDSNTLIIRQKDAHAWAEYWQPSLGWLRVDPTAAVAPLRIDQGLDASLTLGGVAASGFFGEALGLGHLKIFGHLRQQFTQLNDHWTQLVVGFDNKRQLIVLKQLLGEVTPVRVASFVVAGLCAVLFLVALFFRITQGKQSEPLEKLLYQRFCDKVKLLGVERGSTEPSATFGRRLASEYPHHASEVMAITRRFELIAYQEIKSPAIYSDLQRMIKAFKPVMPVKAQAE